MTGSCEQDNECLGGKKKGGGSKFLNKQSLTCQGFCSIQFVRWKSNSETQTETRIKGLLI